jgi:hypothetical protein
MIWVAAGLVYILIVIVALCIFYVGGDNDHRNF